MTRRSTRLMRLENSLYNYNNKKESWDIKQMDQTNNLKDNDLFELGSYFTCKHMSQKVNPISFRINNNRTWDSTWYSNYKYFGIENGKLQIDLNIREYIQGIFKQLNILIDKIYIKEIDNNYLIKISIYEPGISTKREALIDKKKVSRYNVFFENINKDSINPFYKNKQKNSSKNWFIDSKKMIHHIENQLVKQFNKKFYISLVYKKDIGESAALLGNFLCNELEKPNMNFKRALRNLLNKIKIKDQIRGLRINCSGRLGRAPMAKMEWFKYGSIPLTKISANIDYIQLMGKTKFGSFGIKIWLYKH